MYPRPSHLVPIALLLAPSALAQTVSSSALVSTAHEARSQQLFESQPPRVGMLLGLLELPTVGEGWLDGVLLDEEGLPLFDLDADLTVYVPSGSQSSRFVYGGMYGRIAALSAEAGMAEALVQGEWSRFGAQSPHGELLAMVYVATPAGPRSLGTLRAAILLDGEEGGGAQPVVQPAPQGFAADQPDPTVPPLQPGTQVVSSQHLGAHVSPHFELQIGGIVDPGPNTSPAIASSSRVAPRADAQATGLGQQGFGSQGVAAADGDGLLAGPNHGTFAGTWVIRIER